MTPEDNRNSFSTLNKGKLGEYEFKTPGLFRDHTQFTLNEVDENSDL